MNEDDGKHGEDHADYWEQSAFLQTLKTEVVKLTGYSDLNHWEDESFGAFWEWDYP